MSEFTPTRFRKRPVVIEAAIFDSPDRAVDIANWCGGRAESDARPVELSDVLDAVRIPTLEGVMTAKLGDWIIRGVKGELYPCKPDIFEATYEPA